MRIKKKQQTVAILGKIDNAGYHNSIFRGKDITNYYDDQSLFTRISDGTFDDLYVGDYIVKNGITWRIAGFDVYLHRGNPELTKHHAVIVPDTNLTNASMNDAATTANGYLGSKMLTTTLEGIYSTYIEPIFNNHIISYRNLLTNATTSTLYNRLGTNTGGSSNWDWADRKLDLMNENQVLGSIVWSSSGYETGGDSNQFPLFGLAPEYIYNRNTYWLRTIADNTRYVYIVDNGFVRHGSANSSSGVRPYFYID